MKRNKARRSGKTRQARPSRPTHRQYAGSVRNGMLRKSSTRTVRYSASALVPSTVMETCLTNCARPFPRELPRGAYCPKPWENLYTFTIRVLWSPRKAAMLAGALPPAHPGTLAAPEHVTELNPTNALCGDDVRNAGPKKSREMASEAYRDNSGGGSCCHAAQRTRPGIGATAPIRAAASLHHQ